MCKSHVVFSLPNFRQFPVKWVIDISMEPHILTQEVKWHAVLLLLFVVIHAHQGHPEIVSRGQVFRLTLSVVRWSGPSFLGLSMSWRRRIHGQAEEAFAHQFQHQVPLIGDYPRGRGQRGSRGAATLPSGGSRSQRCWLHWSAGDGSQAAYSRPALKLRCRP